MLENDEVIESQDATTEITADAQVKLREARPGELKVRAPMVAPLGPTRIRVARARR